MQPGLGWVLTQPDVIGASPILARLEGEHSQDELTGRLKGKSSSCWFGSATARQQPFSSPFLYLDPAPPPPPAPAGTISYCHCILPHWANILCHFQWHVTHNKPCDYKVSPCHFAVENIGSFEIPLGDRHFGALGVPCVAPRRGREAKTWLGSFFLHTTGHN